MQTGNIATPFGRRPITVAHLQRQRSMVEITKGKTADKWKVFRDISAAMNTLSLQSNSLAVLDALLSFYPHNELSENAQMIVFPSNSQLSLRAHGMAGATLRRHIAILIEAGLVIRKDSANGKRYARKDRNGQIETAFGFDLSPLLARAEELARLARDILEAKTRLRTLRETLTICRRDVRKLISAGLEEGAEGDWYAIEAIYVALVARIPRAPTIAEAGVLVQELTLLREEILSRLEKHVNSENPSTNDALNEQHIQNSNTDCFKEFEHCLGNEGDAKPVGNNRQMSARMKAFPLTIVLKACHSISDYGPGGAITNWRDLMSAAIVVRTMLGVTPSAYQDACNTMGPENAATTMACILEKSHLIKSAGAYLRDLTKRASAGKFSLGPMLAALLHAHGKGL